MNDTFVEWMGIQVAWLILEKEGIKDVAKDFGLSNKKIENIEGA